MPRKKLYHTQEQQRLANNAKAKKWRDSHSNIIRARRQDKRRADEAARVKELCKKRRELKKGNKMREGGESANRVSDDSVQKARTLHSNFITSIPNQAHYVEKLYQEFQAVSADDYTWFDQALRSQETVFTALQKLQHHILNAYGVGDEWREVESYRQDVWELINWIEDVQCYAIEGFVELDYAWSKRKLRYQQCL
ncbi:hypothetical protein AAF712_012738 [Marasmius tenuissimus]|uniref:BZIP domain-containing protein n=1 Tax=Marasmius tenuissimus TaxID=585030 RepID=A0ABR2ZGV8_9AGAR